MSLSKVDRNGFSLIEVIISLIVAAITMIFIERISMNLRDISQRFDTVSSALESSFTIRSTLQKLIDEGIALDISQSDVSADGQTLRVYGHWPRIAAAAATDSPSTEHLAKIYVANEILWIAIDGFGKPEAIASHIRSVTFGNAQNDGPTSQPTDGEYSTELSAQIGWENGQIEPVILYTHKALQYCSALAYSGSCNEQ